MRILLPFMLADKLGLSLWPSYGIAFDRIVLGFGLHRSLTSAL
jgi:hypothetical protein